MSFNSKDIIDKYGYNEEKAAFLQDFKVVDVLFRRQTGLLIIKAESERVLPFNIYSDVLNYFKNTRLTTILGTATSDIAEMGLREIAKTVRNLQLEEILIGSMTLIKLQK